MSSKPRVLLADDSKFFRAIESKFLQKTPIEVIEAENCKETLTKVRDEKPDLVYVYFALPDEGGEYCCRQIKNDPQLKSIPVVMICDNGEPDQIKISQSVGCDSFLVKPLDRLSFLQVGRQFLEVIREHRQSSFFPLSITAKDQAFKGKCLDISCGGLFIETSEDVAVGEILSLEFKLPDLANTKISCSAEVMWLNRKPNAMKPHYPNGLGIKFVDLSDQNQKAIARLSKK
jgi:CheY-like chemotaxis protein